MATYMAKKTLVHWDSTADELRLCWAAIGRVLNKLPDHLISNTDKGLLLEAMTKVAELVEGMREQVADENGSFPITMEFKFAKALWHSLDVNMQNSWIPEYKLKEHIGIVERLARGLDQSLQGSAERPKLQIVQD